MNISSIDWESGLTSFTNVTCGLPTVILLAVTGILITVMTRGIQIKGALHSISVIMGKYNDPNADGELSHFSALSTALSGTIGLGSIAGTAVALTMGGPGAMFWMILFALVGMATKFAECTLAVMCRTVSKKGTIHGGPMYYIEKGLGKKWKPLAMIYAGACLISCFGMGNMFQTNQIATILNATFAVPHWLTGIICAVLATVVILGGLKRIGKVTSWFVPSMALIYFAGAMVVIISQYEKIPEVISLIISSAFGGKAAVGGVMGVTIQAALVQGLRRAAFSSETGVGSSPIAHAAAKTSEPVREGIVALIEPFLTTVIICSLTAFVILTSGVDYMGAGNLSGATLTAKAFELSIKGFGTIFIPIAVFLFGWSTLLSWYYYGNQSTYYLFGKKGVRVYKYIYCSLAFVGAILSPHAVVLFSDSMMGMMILPNVLAILIMSPRISRATKEYFAKLKAGEFDYSTNEDEDDIDDEDIEGIEDFAEQAILSTSVCDKDSTEIE